MTTTSTPARLRSPRILFGHAAFLAVAGVSAWALSGFEDRARTAVLSGTGTAVLLFACGVLAAQYPTRRLAASIGIHLGMLFAALFAAIFLWRALEAYAGWSLGRAPLDALVAAHNLAAAEDSRLSTKPAYLPILLGSMALVSAGVLGALIASRPTQSTER
jgi:hypothetical protein